MPANNVLDFTARLVDKQLDEYYDAEQEEYDEYEETLNALYDDLLDSLQQYGIANDEDGFIKDFAYTMEAVRSMVDRQFGYNHNFHELVDEKMVIEKDENGFPSNILWKPSLTTSEE